MPRSDYKTCRNCGRDSSEAGALSHTRLCLDCAKWLSEENARQIREGRGPLAEHRIRRRIMAAHRELIAISQRGLDADHSEA